MTITLRSTQSKELVVIHLSIMNYDLISLTFHTKTMTLTLGRRCSNLSSLSITLSSNTIGTTPSDPTTATLIGMVFHYISNFPRKLM